VTKCATALIEIYSKALTNAGIVSNIMANRRPVAASASAAVNVSGICSIEIPALGKLTKYVLDYFNLDSSNSYK